MTHSSKRRQACPYGFSCAAMLMQPGIIAADCENLVTCKQLARSEGRSVALSEEEEFALVRIQEEQRRIWVESEQSWHETQERIRESIRLSRHQAAILMLEHRGRSQNLADFSIGQTMQAIEETIAQLRQDLDTLTQDYIAPDGVEAHSYYVKRPTRQALLGAGVNPNQVPALQQTFWYNKLTAQRPIFTPALRNRPVRVLHLSHNNDPRNIEGRRGIERRNRLKRITTQLEAAQAALMEAARLAREPLT